MIVGAYSLDLYCDNQFNEHNMEIYHYYYTEGSEYHVNKSVVPHTFVGETFSECVKQARQCGWKVNRSKAPRAIRRL